MQDFEFDIDKSSKHVILVKEENRFACMYFKVLQGRTLLKLYFNEDFAASDMNFNICSNLLVFPVNIKGIKGKTA